MCERCKARAEKAIRQGTGFRVTPGEAAKMEEIFYQMCELERKKDLWWEKQLALAGFPEGEYQFLPTEGVIVRKESRDIGNTFDELEELFDKAKERWRGGLSDDKEYK